MLSGFQHFSWKTTGSTASVKLNCSLTYWALLPSSHAWLAAWLGLLIYSLTLYSADLIFVSYLTSIKYHTKSRAKAADFIVSTISCVDFRYHLFDWWAAWPWLSSSPSFRLFYMSFGVRWRRILYLILSLIMRVLHVSFVWKILVEL
jgi:hypothetical protein